MNFFVYMYILQMFTSLDEEIHVIVANLQMKTYVFHTAFTYTLKKSEVGNQFMLEHTNVTLSFFCVCVCFIFLHHTSLDYY